MSKQPKFQVSQAEDDKLVALANGLPMEGAVQPTHDLVALANAAAFADTYFSEPLTAYAAGWRDPSNLEEELDFIAPPVQSSRRFEFRSMDQKADFISETDDTREPGADFKAVKYQGKIVQQKTVNKGLAIYIDLDEIGDQPNFEQIRTGFLMRRIMRNELRRAVGIFAAGATMVAKTWDSKADPDGDILKMLESAADLIGFQPNRVYVGQKAWNKRVLSLRSQLTSGALATTNITPDELAAWAGVDQVFRSRSRYADSANTKAQIVGAQVFGFYAEQGMSQEDPSHVKRFWSPCVDGSKFRVYRQVVSEKIIKISVEHYSNVVQTGNVGLLGLTIS